ncbi:MAG: hypothetical protein M3217_04325 [Actinomycetota bacterium]|nr:hypothetical protein [Actinomycetota bacterium]
MEAPSRVRTREDDHGVLGAGIVIRGGQVLICAHVISPDARETPPSTVLIVDFVGLPDAPSARARIADACWFPPRDREWHDDRGDVVLLELANGRFEALLAAPLRRLPSRSGRL